jgi:hypothetical protein
VTPKQFVVAIRTSVAERASENVLQQLKSPAGRRPDKRLLELSRWFNSLEPKDQDRVREVMNQSVDHAVFGFLCVLDGVRAIEAHPKGTLNLQYVSPEGEITILNSELLHELYD